MPHTPHIHIVRTWRFRNEPGRIHYMISTHDGRERHLWQDDSTPLGQVLDGHLLELGYTGPKSGEADDESHGLPAEP